MGADQKVGNDARTAAAVGAIGSPIFAGEFRTVDIKWVESDAGLVECRSQRRCVAEVGAQLGPDGWACDQGAFGSRSSQTFERVRDMLRIAGEDV